MHKLQLRLATLAIRLITSTVDMDDPTIELVDKVKLLAASVQDAGDLLSKDQMRDQINGSEQAGDSSLYANGLSGDEETRRGCLKGIKKIACMGSGFVGGMYHRTTSHELAAKLTLGPTSAVMAFKSNVEVTVVDINPDRIAAWKSMSLPIYEPGLDAIVFAARDGIDIPIHTSGPEMGNSNRDASRRPSLFFSTDVSKAIEEADLIFVCVNTPTKAHGIGKGAGADLSFVEAATRNIARVAKRSKIVVEKSTVPCRTAESIRHIVSGNICIKMLS